MKKKKETRRTRRRKDINTTRNNKGRKEQHNNNIRNPLEPNKQGFCLTHRILGKQIEVTKSTWKDCGGGKGYGLWICEIKSQEVYLS